MLPTAHRLHRESDFEVVWRHGREFRLHGLRIRTARSIFRFARIGIVVSKKVARKAVTRNRMRRIIREAVRPLVPRLIGNRDYLLVPTSQFAPSSSIEVRRDLEIFFQKGRLISQ
ncbi:MAG TPA: ribonuclease P protein component [Candidatus Kerfeldbacteria bacterium]|nr:ribonuclease P protein component [Candidatus Kerfeldbacteria bacterium]